MAAGWVPSSYNRTAQAFSQPGGSGTANGGSGVRAPAFTAPPPTPVTPATKGGKPK